MSNFVPRSSGVDLSIRTEPEVDWIKYDSNAMILSGDAPEGTEKGHVELKIEANSETSYVSESRSLRLSFVQEGMITSDTETSPRRHTPGRCLHSLN